MRCVILDHSTITSVQRILGEIPVRDKGTIDGDIIAFESLIHSILFYDKVVVTDDYITRHIAARKRLFPHFHFLELGQEALNKVHSSAHTILTKFAPRVQNNTFDDDDFRGFLKILKMNMVFTWDKSQSEYYLTLKMLGEINSVDAKNFSNCATSIFGQLHDAKSFRMNGFEKKVEILDSRGNVIDEKYKLIDTDGGEFQPKTGGAVSSFFSGLIWLAYRTIFYSVLAKEMKTDLVLHPIRHSFHAVCTKNYFLDDCSIYEPLLRTLESNSVKALAVLRSNTNIAQLETTYPIFLAWLANQTSPEHFIEKAYEMRSEQHFVDLRKRLMDIDSYAFKSDQKKFLQESNKLVRDVKSALENLQSKYFVQTRQGIPFSNIVQPLNMVGQFAGSPTIPSLPISFPMPDWLQRVRDSISYKPVYRRVVEDLATVAKLGSLHDRIVSLVQVDNSKPSYSLKTEGIEFLGKKAHWKIPMP